MKYLVTGSSGHLGEALVRVLKSRGLDVVSFDVKPGDFTDRTGSAADRSFVTSCMKGVDVVLHAATLHKPHVATHSWQDFIETNITGTLTLLEAAAAEGVSAFVFTSTTSVFGHAMTPPADAPAVWINEDVVPQIKNIYGATKRAAEDLCRLAHQKHKLPCLILRTSRFFPEEQDSSDMRSSFSTENAQVNEFLNRRVDIEDVVSAHMLAAERAGSIGFGTYIITATTPFNRHDLAELRKDAPAVITRYADVQDIYRTRGWTLPPSIDRVYDNSRAREELGWAPRFDFNSVLARLENGQSALSDLAGDVGVKGYHDQVFETGPYPVE